jgi:hypothetical protein
MIPLGMGRDGERGRGRRAGAGLVLAGAALLAAGCTGAGHAATASSAPPSHAAQAGPALSPAQRKTAARSYLAIALPANRRLETDFDGLADNHNNLAGAEAALRDAAATERQFDRRLLALNLPAATGTVARLLVTANEARARLTTAAAASTSLSQLHRYQPRLTAANRPVEDAVRVIRSQLGLPPPETS